MVLIKEIIETISVLCKTYNVRIYFNDDSEMVLTKFDYNELAKTGTKDETDIMYEQIYNMDDLKTSLPLETIVIIFSQEADKYFEERDSRKYFNEFEKLEKYLKDNDYIYERLDKVNSSIKDEERDYHQLIAFTKSDDMFDVVISKSLHSYGYEKGLLELSGCLVKSKDDNSEGFLTADDIIKRLENE